MTRCQEKFYRGGGFVLCKNPAKFSVATASSPDGLKVCGVHVRYWRSRKHKIEEIKAADPKGNGGPKPDRDDDDGIGNKPSGNGSGPQ